MTNGFLQILDINPFRDVLSNHQKIIDKIPKLVRSALDLGNGYLKQNVSLIIFFEFVIFNSILNILFCVLVTTAKSIRVLNDRIKISAD